MSFTLIYKIYGFILSPLIVALGGVAMVNSLSIPIGYVIGVVIAVSLFSLRIVVRYLHVAALEKQIEARKRYSNKSYNELKTLFLANPHEAALFIDTLKSTKGEKEFNSLPALR